METELIEKTGEIIADFGLKKIKGYKTKGEWKCQTSCLKLI